MCMGVGGIGKLIWFEGVQKICNVVEGLKVVLEGFLEDG